MNKKIIGILVVMLLILSAQTIFVSAGFGSPKTIYVDDDNTEGPWLGTQEYPYQYIRDGIENALAGDTVFVFSGTYYEKIVIDKKIDLIGENKQNTIIDGSLFQEMMKLVYIKSSGVNITQFTMRNTPIDGFSKAVYTEVQTPPLENINIDECLLVNNMCAIWLDGVSYCSVKNCEIHHNTGAPIEVTEADNIIIENCICHDNGGYIPPDPIPYVGGIFIWDCSDIILRNSVLYESINAGLYLSYSSYLDIYDNDIFENKESGIIMDNLENSIIYDNDIYQNLDHGVLSCGSYSETYLQNNNIYENDYDFGSFQEGGILCSETYGLIINKNSIFSNSENGIHLRESHDIHIIDNLISNHEEIGIYSYNSHNSFIITNVITNNGDKGIGLDHSNNNQIYHNSFLSNDNPPYDSAGVNNIWDNGYPSGGNYWDRYDEESEGAYDYYHGENQDIPPGDDIVDSPYINPTETVQDNYPLLYSYGSIPPNPPEKPYRKPSLLDWFVPFGIEFTYYTSTQDFNGDDVYYWFEWGDGTNSGWIGPYASGDEISSSHSWNGIGWRNIKVKAKDTNDFESGWSDIKQVFAFCLSTDVEAEGTGTTRTITATVQEGDTVPGENNVLYTYEFDFGDGDTLTIENVNSSTYSVDHEYSDGLYTITVDTTAVAGEYSDTDTSQTSVAIGTAVVDGTVYDSDGDPVSNAKVSVVGGEEYDYTDSFGYYILDLDYYQTYYLKASKANYVSQTKQVYTDGNKEVDFTINHKPNVYMHAWKGLLKIGWTGPDPNGYTELNGKKNTDYTFKAYGILGNTNDPDGSIVAYRWTREIEESCFLAGTKIAMGDGTYKNIEEVEIGDIVKAYDEENDAVVNSSVISTFSHEPEEMTPYYLIINEELYVTPNHLMFINGDWEPAGDILVGDKMKNLSGKKIKVYSVDEVYEQLPTYNLEVEEYHTFYAEDILVHNSKLPPDFPWVYSSTISDRTWSWSEVGDYEVTLSVKDDDGAISSAVILMQISGGGSQEV